MPDAAYYRAWRAAHPEYRKRQAAVRAEHRRVHGRESRANEYRKSRAQPYEPLPVLYPELNHGSAMSFWEDELRMDLAQERALAELEGVDPDEAVLAYRRREKAWLAFAAPLIEEVLHGSNDSE
jgi:hypothetical protein